MQALRETCAGRLTRAGAWLVALLVVHALSAGPARAQETASPQIDDERAEQESIHRSKGGAVPGGYIVRRGLAKYAELLPSGFERALRGLTPADRWLDIGAGSGLAILDYYAPEYGRGQDEKPGPRGRARAVAVSIEDRRTEVWHQ